MKEILITSSVLILALLILRLLFAKRVRPTLMYAAWALVALRLLIPVQIGEVDFSVLTAAQPLTETVTEFEGLRVIGQNEREAEVQVIGDYIQQDQTVFTPEVQEYIQESLERNETTEEIATAISKTQSLQNTFVPEVQQQVVQQVAEQTRFVSLGQAAAAVWLAGVAVMAVWFVAVNLRFSRKLREQRQKLEVDSPIPVYVSELVASPCLVGLFRPAIYLTPECGEKEESRRHVLTHELTHYAHKDHIWALVRCVCLCVYWFDPLVWIAARCSRRDCELACDQGALKRLGEEERIAYGKTLLEVVSHASASSKLMQTATAMNETKEQLKERVEFIVKKPKWSLIAAIAMVLICAIVAGCATTGSTTGSTVEPDADSTALDAKRYTIKVQKYAGTYESVDNSALVLVYNGKGELLEYQGGTRRIVYTYDERGNMLSRMMYSSSGELLEESYYTYNDVGQLIRLTGIGHPTNLYAGSSSLVEYSYDEAGNLVYEKTNRGDASWSECFYDTNGNLVKKLSYLEGTLYGCTLYTYTQDGKILTQSTERDGELRSGCEYIYDESGRILREEKFIISNGVRKETTCTYTYDDLGRCIRYDMGGFQGEYSYEEYTYDAMGNMLSSKYYQYTGEVSEHLWTYDAQGNMLSSKFIGERTRWGNVWTYDAEGNVASMVDGNTQYILIYTWPEEALPQNIQEDAAEQIAAFTKLTSLSPEVYARIYN